MTNTQKVTEAENSWEMFITIIGSICIIAGSLFLWFAPPLW